MTHYIDESIKVKNYKELILLADNIITAIEFSFQANDNTYIVENKIIPFISLDRFYNNINLQGREKR